MVGPKFYFYGLGIEVAFSSWIIRSSEFDDEEFFVKKTGEEIEEFLISSWKIKMFFIFFILRLWDLLLIFLQCCNVKNFHGKEEILGPKLG